MNVKVNDIIRLIEEIAPLHSQEEWDNSGIQIGDREMVVSGILLSMDVTDKSIDYAIDNNLNLLISHHPLFFSEVKSIDFSTYKGGLIKKIIENNIFIYSAHTNLDAAEIGVNFVLAERIGLENVKSFSNFIEGENIGVMGFFPEENLEDLIEALKNISNTKDVRLYGKPTDKVKKIAVIGGSGSFGIDIARSIGADVLITGDIKHHDAQRAYENELLLIDIGHFYSEIPVLKMLKKYLGKNSNGIEIKIFDEPVYFINY